MKILLLSDTHSYIGDDILKYTKDVDEIWHGGDIGDWKVYEQLKQFKPIRAVYGNIDGREFRQELQESLIWEIGKIRIGMKHIGAVPPKYNKEVMQWLDLEQPHLFICGHSHILRIIADKGRQLLYMNPGASGKHGFHTMRTMIRFQIQMDETSIFKAITNCEIIELEKRS